MVFINWYKHLFVFTFHIDDLCLGLDLKTAENRKETQEGNQIVRKNRNVLNLNLRSKEKSFTNILLIENKNRNKNQLGVVCWFYKLEKNLDVLSNLHYKYLYLAQRPLLMVACLLHIKHDLCKEFLNALQKHVAVKTKHYNDGAKLKCIRKIYV